MLRKSDMLAAVLLGMALISATDVGAFELTGAWAVSADQCGKVFIRKGRANEIGFTALSDRHGGGFIVEANRVRGKFTTCMIKSRKDEGQTLNLIVDCKADIMLSNIQFSLKFLDDDSIVRQFPGIEGLEIRYYRCPV